MSYPVHLLVTGGSGFLGKAVIGAVHERHPDWHITSLDIEASSSPQADWIDHVGIDVRDADAVYRAVQIVQPTAIVHCAGIVPAGNERYNLSLRDEVFAVNVGGTKNMLEAAQACSVQAFCFTSSVCLRYVGLSCT